MSAGAAIIALGYLAALTFGLGLGRLLWHRPGQEGSTDGRQAR